MVEDEALIGSTTNRAASEAEAIRHLGKEPAAGGSVGERRRMAQAIKLFAHFAEPPAVSSFALVVSEPEKEVKASFLTSVDQNIFLVYAGPRAPSWRSSGYYLIYDAAKNSLTVIPEMPLGIEDAIGGSRAVLMRGAEEGAYVLAELTFTHTGTRSSDFYSSTKDLGFRFVTLPDKSVYDRSEQDADRPVKYRNVACFNDSFKFLHVNKKQPATLNIWKLENLDLVKWTSIQKICFENLWADANFCLAKVPMWVPVFPTLSPQEDVVYFLVGGWCHRYKDFDEELEDNSVIIGINFKSQKLESYEYCQTAIMLVATLHSEIFTP
ncbi:hypothetical protein QOZ80_7AG0574570 [Eleusine coracana subsp. coracana]|nr:hypothetical protein QOZ80_7AG0574570 [Eleusine coracana subsp. coracana]